MDSFFGIGLFELVMIAVVALLVLGPERLPGAMREVAKWVRQLRNLTSDLQSQFSEEFELLDEMNPRRLINEALDPNAPSAKARPPAKPGGAATGPAAARPPAAKPPVPAPRPATVAASAAASTGAAIVNGEPENTILPPSAAGAGTTPQAAAEQAPPVSPADAAPIEAPAVPPAPAAAKPDGEAAQ